MKILLIYILALVSSTAVTLSITGTPVMSSFGQFSFDKHTQIAWQNTRSSLKELLDLTNDIRTNPAKYADYIQTIYIDTFEDGVVKSLNRMSNEGSVAVYTEARDFLRNSKPHPPLKLDAGLTAAAYKHSLWMSRQETMSHTGEGGSKVLDRMKEFGGLDGCCQFRWAENIVTSAPQWSALIAILDWIIDDGVTTRGHRKNFFGPYEIVGFGLTAPTATQKEPKWYLTQKLSLSTYVSRVDSIQEALRRDSGLTEYRVQTGSW